MSTQGRDPASPRGGGAEDLAAPTRATAKPLTRPAASGEVHDAVRLLLSRPGEAVGDEQVVDFLRMAIHRAINLQELRVAEHGGRLVCAMLPILNAGRTMLLLAGGDFHDPHAQQAAEMLIEQACERHRSRALLAEALIDPYPGHLVDIYTARGFETIAELVYLQVPSSQPVAEAQLPPGLHWRSYSAQAHPLFAQAVLRTYEQSLDCPGLNGKRGIEDILAGHKACGRFDPKLWLLLCTESEPLGALLLTRPFADEGLELVYLGLVPEARGRGLADLLMQQALWLAAQWRAKTLFLAVDAANAPAQRLYYRFGMRRICSKLALVRELGEAGATAPPTVHNRMSIVQSR
jgi:mycothiol synthase